MGNTNNTIIRFPCFNKISNTHFLYLLISKCYKIFNFSQINMRYSQNVEVILKLKPLKFKRCPLRPWYTVQLLDPIHWIQLLDPIKCMIYTIQFSDPRLGYKNRINFFGGRIHEPIIGSYYLIQFSPNHVTSRNIVLRYVGGSLFLRRRWRTTRLYLLLQCTA